MLPWLLVGYMWLFVHRPHEIWTQLASFRIVMVYMVCVFILWVITSPDAKRPLGNIFTAAVFLYAFALGLATVFSSFGALTDALVLDWLKYVVFFVIMMTSIKTEKDLKILVTGFVVAFFLYIAHSYRAFLGGSVHWSVGANRIVPVGTTFSNANDFGTMIVCALPLALPFITVCKRYWHYLFLLGYVLLTMRCAMLSGSRTALIMMVALAVLPVVFSRHRFKLIPIILIVLPLCWSVMPEQYQNRYRTMWDPTIDEAANANMEGRTAGMYNGLENWKNYPIFGVGPGCHGRPAGTPFRSHNLIGEVTGEQGTVGTLAFLFMMLCFCLNHYSVWKSRKFLLEKNLGNEAVYCWRVSTAVMYAVLMLQIQGFGLHNALWFHWLWFGAFQALAATIMQEKVNAAIQGKLLPKISR